ncbi:hypothetical protein GCN74_01685 [Janthinobacterium sp. FT14W]|uniref:hypothetical protein n=1 Tax=Janthinobacterium sp. FT14W TaxID=2654253 RepID=UPI0012645947|nr:hypothetical protein [Janthinobacterium sp. FT14W]KAB8062525.1 hypothetical protein GCN74_01685 [Janthinobacterium sp. FT14W]
MKKQTILCALVSLLAACGGGGGGDGGSGNGSSPDLKPVVPPAPVLASINAADALKKFLSSDLTISNLASNDGSLGTATLIVSQELGQPAPFVTNGVSQQAASVKVISLLRSNASGKLQYRNTWKLHLDANMQPIGMAVGYADAGYKACMSVTGRNELPTLSNASGTYFSGVQTLTYTEGFKAGKYANYCDPSGTASANVEWSIAAGSPSPYFCLTMPDSLYTAKTRMCIPVDGAGTQNNSVWVRLFKADGSSAIDYKNTAQNKPLEQLGTAVDANNYWYGAVWRPQDGYIYQRYQDTKFASEQACRDQTTINWKATWDATNISWTCVNVQSK